MLAAATAEFATKFVPPTDCGNGGTRALCLLGAEEHTAFVDLDITVM